MCSTKKKQKRSGVNCTVKWRVNMYKAWSQNREEGDWTFLTSHWWLKQIVQTKGSGGMSGVGRHQGAGETEQGGFADTESSKECAGWRRVGSSWYWHRVRIVESAGQLVSHRRSPSGNVACQQTATRSEKIFDVLTQCSAIIWLWYLRIQTIY